MRAEIARGAGWMLLFKAVDRLLGVVSTLVLARLLIPADFGLVAMAMSVIALIELASAFNFEAALIQRKDLSRDHYDTAWTLNLGLGAACAALTALLAYPTAQIFGEPRLQMVMFVLAAGRLVASFESIGPVEFRRTMDFRKEFVFLSSKRLLAFVVTLILAFVFRSYWALVIGSVFGRVAGVVLSFSMQPQRMRLSLGASRELFGFSGGLLAVNLLGAVIARAPHFFVGKLNGPQALGSYTVGSELAYMPSVELIAPINRAVFPGYARLAHDSEKLRDTFLDVIAAILLLALPASVGLAAVAEPMVRVLLGERWIEAVPVIRVLAFAGAVAAVTSNNASVYMALGRTLLFPIALAARLFVLLVGLLLLAPRLGVIGAAYAELIAYGLSLLVSYPILFRVLHVPVGHYLARAWRPVVASAAMGYVVLEVTAAIPAGTTSMSALPQLLGGVVSGVATYLGALWLLWRLAGRPRGAEAAALEQAELALARVRALRSA